MSVQRGEVQMRTHQQLRGGAQNLYSYVRMGCICLLTQQAMDVPVKFLAVALSPRFPVLHLGTSDTGSLSLAVDPFMAPVPSLDSGCSLIPFSQAVCGYGSQEALPLRPAREGELYFPEDREVNLVELALATNIPKGCAETAVRGSCWGPAWGGDSSWVVSSGVGLAGEWDRIWRGRWCEKGGNPSLTYLFDLGLVHVSYLDGKGNLAPQGSGKG